MLTTNILVVNNVRDIESDRQAGRSNIPVRFGRSGGEIEYLVMLVIAYLVPAATVLLKAGPMWTLLAYFSLPTAIALFRAFRQTPTGRALNAILARSAQLLLLYSLLLGVGFGLGLLAK